MSNGLLAAPYLLLLVIRRFRKERCSQVAASLAFTTLLSIVPLLTVTLAVVSKLPVSAKLSAALERFLLDNLLPEKAGQVIATYILQFSQKAHQLTVLGSLMLVVTAFILMLTIDRTFNAIWRVSRPRRLASRIPVYALVLILGPALLGAGLAATTFIVSTSLGWVDEPPWVRALLFRMLPDLFMAGLFSLLYFAVPDREVRPMHAVIGGTAAAFGLVLVQRAFGLYIVKFSVYSLIYGAFAVVPIFLVWLYLSWSVVLTGALITASLAELAGPRSGAPSRAKG